MSAPKKKLFALMLERKVNGVWLADANLVYAHAFTPVQAVFGYRQSVAGRDDIRVIHCGEVIGYFADEEKPNEVYV